MARYHVGFTTVAAAAGAAYFDIRTVATDRVRVLEIGVFSTAGTANLMELARATTVGTASTTVVPVAGDPAESAATAVVGTAWSAAPASTAVPIRSVQLPANVGSGVIWVFAFGDLVIPVSSSIVAINRGAVAGPVSRGYVLFDE